MMGEIILLCLSFIIGVLFVVSVVVGSRKGEERKVNNFVSELGTNGGTLSIKVDDLESIIKDVVVWRYVDYKVNKEKRCVEFMLKNGDISELPFYVITGDTVKFEIEKLK